MSGDEKNAQIGAAVTEYQAAKIETAHVEEKLDRVFKAYRDAGNTMDRQRGTTSEPSLVDGRVKFGWATVEASLILAESDLVKLIEERDAARKRLAIARQRMQALGVGNLG